jgi:predicted  nucleic acid-binding Zn-ribbon protein
VALEELKAQIAMLLGEMESEPKDVHELYERLHEKLNEIKAMGMPVPEDLLSLERQLEEEFARRGRRPRGGA